MKEYAKHLLVRTPFEQSAHKIRHLFSSRQLRHHPELSEIYMEPVRIEQMMQREIGNGFNCIDVGCHLGSTLSTIVSLSPKGNHIAFEPIPYKASWLKRKFPEVDVREVALSNRSGEVKFYYNANQSGFSGLHQHMAKNKKILELTVESECLDNILPPDHRVDFMKVDVEGGELAVLQGAADMLRRDRPILLFECTNSGLSSFAFTSAQIFEFLTEQLSYCVFLVKHFLEDGEPLDFEQFHNALQYPFQAFNFIAVTKH